MRTSALTISIVALTFGLACQQNPPMPAARPSSLQQAAAPSAQPTSAPSAHHPTSAPSSQPAQPSGGEPISGTLSVDPALKDQIGDTDVLFIMARTLENGQPGRFPVAVKRVQITKDQLPLQFELSAANTMMPGTPFKGPFSVSARLDKDGDPITKQNDDLYAFSEDAAENGTSDIKLVLKKMPNAPASQPSSGSAPTSSPH